MGGVDITRAPEAVTGRAISYVGSSAYLFPLNVRENLLYGLKHRPISDAVYEGDALRDHEFHLREVRRTGGCLLDYNADWIDYAAAGANNAQELEARVLEVLKVVDLEEHIFELGLKSGADPAKVEELRDKLLGARSAMHDRLETAGQQGWVERFDPRATTATQRSRKTSSSAHRWARRSTSKTSRETPTSAACSRKLR
jgi:putative ABC transport system ATP-binding protein